MAQSSDEIDRFLAEHPDIKFVDALMFDLVGEAVGKRYPVRDMAKLYDGGCAFCVGITTLDALGTSWDVEGIGFSDGDPDAIARPLPGTLVAVPWADGLGQCMIVPEDPNDPKGWCFDPRAILARVVERFSDLNLRPTVACELEFYLLKPERDEEGRVVQAAPARQGRDATAPRVLNFDKLDAWADFLADVDAACQAQNLPAGAASAEYGGAQFEINLGHIDDPVLAADQALLMRRVVQGVARKHGLIATFMSKPLTDQSGSGLHIHASMLDQNGQNVFDETRADKGARMLNAIAGMQATSWDALAFFAPNLGAYRRYEPDQFGPVNTSWGFNNRSVAFRIPAGPAKARRIEHRIAGADANPYLVMAAMLAGMHHGITNGLEASEPSTGNAGDSMDPDMPTHLWVALDRLAESDFFQDYFGERYPKAYADMKRAELDAFLADDQPREYDWFL